MKKYEMKKMEDFTTANYQGFTLKKGFWYGKNLRGQAVATSTWVACGNVAIYTKTENGWKMEWHDVEAWYLPDDLKEELAEEIESNDFC